MLNRKELVEDTPDDHLSMECPTTIKITDNIHADIGIIGMDFDGTVRGKTGRGWYTAQVSVVVSREYLQYLLWISGGLKKLGAEIKYVEPVEYNHKSFHTISIPIAQRSDFKSKAAALEFIRTILKYMKFPKETFTLMTNRTASAKRY